MVCLVENCCTSYPIATSVAVLSHGHKRIPGSADGLAVEVRQRHQKDRNPVRAGSWKRREDNLVRLPKRTTKSHLEWKP